MTTRRRYNRDRKRWNRLRRSLPTQSQSWGRVSYDLARRLGVIAHTGKPGSSFVRLEKALAR